MTTNDVSAPSGESASDIRARHERRWWFVVCTVAFVGLALSVAGGMAWRDNVRKGASRSFRATATNVTATLGTLLGRDAGFVLTLRSVLTMQPRLSPTGFDSWLSQLRASGREVGAIGSAFVASVPSSRLAQFEKRRNSDPVFLAMVGNSVLPITHHHARYCLIAGGQAIIPVASPLVRMVQGDWCSPSSLAGLVEAPLLRVAVDTGQVLVSSVNLPGLHTTFLETAFYRRGAPLITVAQRRAAALGWLISSFDMATVVRAAIGSNRGLTVAVYHTTPGSRPVLAGQIGRTAPASALTQDTRLSIDGRWRVTVSGTPLDDGLSAVNAGRLAIIGGSVVSLLLALLIFTLSRSRELALWMVADKTRALRHQALHDPLTGLPNRVLALDRVAQMLARARRNRARIAALYVDIDGFKQINDTLGHAAGDQFLRLVAGRLGSVVRQADTAARLAGDEFVLLLEGSALDAGPQLVAERTLEVLREPYDMTDAIGRQLSVTASIGVACGQRDSAEALLADADVALYAAKEAGKNCYVLFEPGMHTVAQDRIALELDLAGALEADQLFLVYQPMFDLRTERAVGFEALLRWNHPTRGVISPNEFIPIAESTGLIVPIGRWVLQTACGEAAAWRAQGHPLAIAVNVSGRQLDRDEFVDEVRDALECADLEPAALTIEITETALMRDPNATAGRLLALKELRVRVAIDDFGTGYSSLAYLRQFPVDTLKIDRSFIHAIAGSKEAAALIHTLITLGKSLGLETLGEGIEEPAQLEHLQRESCDSGQGFLFARPLDADALAEFLEAGRGEAAVVGVSDRG